MFTIQSTAIASVGHESAASSIHSASRSASSFTVALSSGPSSKTSGQISVQSPHDMHRSLSTFGFTATHLQHDHDNDCLLGFVPPPMPKFHKLTGILMYLPEFSEGALYPRAFSLPETGPNPRPHEYHSCAYASLVCLEQSPDYPEKRRNRLRTTTHRGKTS